MPEEVVLLAGEYEGPHFRAILTRANPALVVRYVETLEALESACAAPPAKGGLRRLIAFATGVIVPEGVLNGLRIPAYNFHPGPPTYPGSRAASFAIYEGAKEFGATVHEMTKHIDAGPIVAVERFPMPEKARFHELELTTYKVLLKLFTGLAPHIATSDAPLPHIGVEWSGTKRTNADFEKMKEIVADMDEAEIRLRYRAFG